MKCLRVTKMSDFVVQGCSQTEQTHGAQICARTPTKRYVPTAARIKSERGPKDKAQVMCDTRVTVLK